MTHTLGLVTRTPEGRYVGSCSCEKPFDESSREAVETQHDRHIHLEELREIVDKGKGV